MRRAETTLLFLFITNYNFWPPVFVWSSSGQNQCNSPSKKRQLSSSYFSRERAPINMVNNKRICFDTKTIPDLLREILQIAAFRKKKVKSFPVRVCSLDSTLEFDLQNNSTGEIKISALNLHFPQSIPFRWRAVRAMLPVSRI